MEKRLLNITEACEYIGLKQTKAREWLQEIGAKRNIGRAVRYDIYAIDKAIREGVENEEIIGSTDDVHGNAHGHWMCKTN